MDNNEMLEQEEMKAESLPEQVKPPKKKMSFGKGMAIGIATGIIFTLLVGLIGINVFQNVTGYPLLISTGGVKLYTNNTLIDQKTATKADEIMKFINFYYDGDYDQENLRNLMYDAIVDGLGDKYSTYMTAEEYTDFKTNTTGAYCGIGAGLTQNLDTKEVTVIKVYEGTPSEEAGIKEGDKVISADGRKAVEMDLSAFVNLIRGEAGSKVTLELYRESTDETLKVEVERRQVELPSISGTMLDSHTGYIQIAEFQANTVAQFKAKYNELEEKGMENLIVDLRDNPGGLLDSVTELLDFILPEGTVVSVTNKYNQSQEFTSDAKCVKVNLAVLINENSASASEIFAGAIKDYEYGTLIGTNTFGKGIVQSIFPLSNGDAIKLTTAKYYTPNGNYIHGVGIAPDVEIEYERVDEYSYEKDNQIQKAIEILEKGN